MTVTIGELKGYWRKVADAVSSNKMNVTDTDILAALMAIGQTIEDVEAEIRAIKSTEGIKKIADAVKVTADDNTIAGLGALAAAAVTDPAASASVIALLKGMLKQLQGTGTGAAPVQLTGSIVEEVTLLSRQIRQAGNHVYTYNNTKGYKNMLVVLDIYGITGTFGANDGIQLACYVQPTGRAYGDRGATATTDVTKLSSVVSHQIHIGQGVSDTLIEAANSKAKSIAVLPLPAVRAAIKITGTFAEGEGIDCALKAYLIS